MNVMYVQSGIFNFINEILQKMEQLPHTYKIVFEYNGIQATHEFTTLGEIESHQIQDSLEFHVRDKYGEHADISKTVIISVSSQKNV